MPGRCLWRDMSGCAAQSCLLEVRGSPCVRGPASPYVCPMEFMRTGGIVPDHYFVWEARVRA